MNTDNHIENIIIATKYVLLNEIGRGSFGIVFKGIYKNRQGNEDVAIKMENAESPLSLLKHETTILRYLNEKHCFNIPNVHWYGIEEEKRILVLTYYDCNLIEYYDKCQNKVLELDNIIYNAIQILNSVHNNYVIHRDIKPQNFMLKQGKLYLIDFGLSTFYIDAKNEHIKDFGSNDTIIGSPRFVSFFIHNGGTPTRRDDMISIGYLYISLLNGSLPWDFMNIDIDKNGIMDKMSIFSMNNIQRKKQKSWVSIEIFLSSLSFEIHKGLKIWNYLKYCYMLKFIDRPNYDGLSDIFIVK